MWFIRRLITSLVLLRKKKKVARCGCCGKSIADGDTVRAHFDQSTVTRRRVVRMDGNWTAACMRCAEMFCDGIGRMHVIDGKPTVRLLPLEEMYDVKHVA